MCERGSLLTQRKLPGGQGRPSDRHKDGPEGKDDAGICFCCTYGGRSRHGSPYIASFLWFGLLDGIRERREEVVRAMGMEAVSHQT